MSQLGEFHLVQNDLFLRLQRKFGIAPKNHLGVVRRAVFWAIFCWAPIMLWAITRDRLISATSGEPLLAQFAIHTYCLISIPCLILSEAYTLKIIKNIITQFLTCEIIKPDDQPKFEKILNKVSSLRDQTLPWILITSISIAWIGAMPLKLTFQELNWATNEQSLSFGGIWFLYVVRPIFIALLLAWVWRIILLMILFRKIAKLDLHLVATHPDRLGGLGFIQTIVDSFALITFAISAILATKWAHQILFHEESLSTFKLPIAAFLIIVTLLFTLPTLFFIPKLLACKKANLREYRALVAKHARLIHARWIKNEKVSSNLLEAQELGSVADINAMFEAIEKMRIIPFNLKSMIGIVLAAAGPMVFLASTEIPIKDILIKLVKAIV